MLITIRDAENRDVDLLADLNCFVQDIHVAALPGYFKQPETGAVAASFRSRLHRSDVRVWIAHIGEVAVGYAVSVLRERPENALSLARRFCELEEIAVSLAHRQQGVARALVERVLVEARSQGVPDVELNSWAFNVDAHAAFQALGFRPMSVRFRRESDSHE
jgi:ribosomal protein S18 acetylase RimI-like enzyme